MRKLPGLLAVIVLLSACSTTPSSAPVVQTTGSASPTEAAAATEIPTISSALRQIGARCKADETETRWSAWKCTWQSRSIWAAEFEGSEWQESATLSARACDSGWVNRNYEVLSDGSTWTAGADFDSDTLALKRALAGVGLSAQLVKYCDQ